VIKLSDQNLQALQEVWKEQLERWVFTQWQQFHRTVHKQHSVAVVPDSCSSNQKRSVDNCVRQMISDDDDWAKTSSSLLGRSCSICKFCRISFRNQQWLTNLKFHHFNHTSIALTLHNWQKEHKTTDSVRSYYSLLLNDSKIWQISRLLRSYPQQPYFIFHIQDQTVKNKYYNTRIIFTVLSSTVKPYARVHFGHLS